MPDGEVVVWGYYNDGYFLSGGGGGGISEGGGSSDHPQLTPGGGSGPSPLERALTAKCPTADTTARRAADEIAAIPSSYSQEWGGMIVRQSSSIYAISAQLLSSTGQSGESKINYDPADVERLVGSVHNHPPSASPDLAISRYPSDRDWGGIDFLVQQVPAIDSSSSKLYIIDAAGAMRAFSYAHKSSYPKDNEVARRQAGEELPSSIGPATGCVE